MEKKNVVFLTVLAVATLLTAVVGTTFAYFTATVTNTTTPTATTVTTANNLGITYSDGDQITGTTIVPGWVSQTKHITVTNNGDVAVDYQITWDAVTNTFKGYGTDSYTDDLVYSVVETTASNAVLTSGAHTRVTDAAWTKVADKAYSLSVGNVSIGTSTTEVAVAAAPATGSTGVVVPTRTIAANATQKFDITMYFVETGVSQNENQSSTETSVNFSGKLKAAIVATDGIRTN